MTARAELEDVTQLRVLLVEDHEMVATAFSAVIDLHADLDLVAVASTLDDGVARARSIRPDVIITDLHLPDGDATSRIGEMIDGDPDCRVLVLTALPTERALVEMLDAGGSGILDKTQPMSDLIDAVRRVAAGELVVTRALVPALAARASGRSTAPDRSSLTRRELEILEHLADGLNTREIADALMLSTNTVRNHVSHVLTKLDVHSRLAAVSEAMKQGIISRRS